MLFLYQSDNLYETNKQERMVKLSWNLSKEIVDFEQCKLPLSKLYLLKFKASKLTLLDIKPSKPAANVSY